MPKYFHNMINHNLIINILVLIWAKLFLLSLLEPCTTEALGLHQGKQLLGTDRVQIPRRIAFGRLAGMVVISPLIKPQDALAAPPMTAGEADNVGARLERLIRSKPSKVLRPKLDLDFAVLLMRSSYNALDQIDCVPMDQFQRDFFLIRQAEYQPYVDSFGPGAVQQGDLTDPLYFDFISFAQYATISRDVSGDPPAVFEEQQPVEVGEDEPQKFVPIIVRRDSSLLNNDLLPVEHDRLVGEAILDRLITVFGGTASALPVISPGSRPSPDVLNDSLQQMVKLFLINGFAWDGNVSIVKMGGSGVDASGTEFSIQLVCPATLWSGKALKTKKAKPVNDFILKTAKVLLARAGYSVSSSSVQYVKTDEVTSIKIA